MKQYDEIIFNEIIKDYCNSFKNIVTKINSINNNLNNGFIKNVDNEVVTLINNKLKNEYEKINNKANKIFNWWESYNNSIDLLNRGFSSSAISTNADNIHFREAKKILDDEL